MLLDKMWPHESVNQLMMMVLNILHYIDSQSELVNIIVDNSSSLYIGDKIWWYWLIGDWGGGNENVMIIKYSLSEWLMETKIGL